MTSISSANTALPLSLLPIDQHYETVIGRGQKIVNNLRDRTVTQGNLTAQCREFESGLKSLSDRINLPEVVSWLQSLESPSCSGSRNEYAMNKFAKYDDTLRDTKCEYDNQVKTEFTRTYEDVLQSCIESTGRASTLLFVYRTSQEWDLNYHKEEMNDLKQSLDEADTNYRRLEYLNDNKSLEPIPTPSRPCTLHFTPSILGKWQEWTKVTNEVLKIGHTRNQLMKASLEGTLHTGSGVLL